MARIIRLEEQAIDNPGRQTDVLGKYCIFDRDGHRHFALRTYGSDERAIANKESQNIQVCGDVARKLRDILNQHFPD